MIATRPPAEHVASIASATKLILRHRLSQNLAVNFDRRGDFQHNRLLLVPLAKFRFGVSGSREYVKSLTPERMARDRIDLPYNERQRLRHEVKPGITGLAQVYGDYLTSFYHKLRYDWIYINRMSLWQELRILLATVRVVLGRTGT